MNQNISTQSSFNDTTTNIANISPEDIRSFFNFFNAKPDSTTKIFPKNVLITKDDLYVLKDKMYEKLSQHNLYGIICNLGVRFENNKFQEFSCWEQFEKCNWTSSNTVDSILLKWDFMIKFPNYELPQRHTVVVRLSSGIRPEQLFQMMVSGKIEDLDSIDKNLAPVICNVSFVNHLLSEEIINIVDEWNKGLTLASDINPKFKLFRRHKLAVARSVDFFTRFAGILLIVSSLNFILYKFNIQNISELTIKHLQLFIISLGTTYLFFELVKKLATSLASNMMESISEYGDICTFNLTKGDIERQNIITAKNKRYENSIKRGLLVTILVNIICGIITSLICNILF